MRIGACLRAALAALPLLAACEGGGPTALADDASSFEASVRGSVEDEYRGNGRFYARTLQAVDPRTGAPLPPFDVFTISSHSGDRSPAQSIQFSRMGAERPAPGRYLLTHVGRSDQKDTHFIAGYTRGAGAAAEGFVATEGELVVTVSTAERIEGTFRFRGVQNCSGTRQTYRCTSPLDPGLPTVEVSGSFAALAGAPVPARGS